MRGSISRAQMVIGALVGLLAYAVFQSVGNATALWQMAAIGSAALLVGAIEYVIGGWARGGSSEDDDGVV